MLLLRVNKSARSPVTVVGTKEARGPIGVSGTRPGFTLVELLVVIGIIALLISILMPALSRARQQSVRLTCQSNLRQISNAVLMYCNEYKGFFPDTVDRGPGQYRFYTTPAIIQKYLGLHLSELPSLVYGSETENAPNYYCAAYPLVLPRQTNAQGGASRAYGYNDYLADVDLYIGPKNQPLKITAVRRTSQVIMLYDSDYYRPFILDFTLGDMRDNHMRGTNIAFVDGHVEWFKGMDRYDYTFVTAVREGISMDPKYVKEKYP